MPRSANRVQVATEIDAPARTMALGAKNGA